MKKLFIYLNSIRKMSPELEEHLATILRQQCFKKKKIILKKGNVCQHIRFIESGLIRICETVNEKEITTWLQQANEIFIAIDSFFDQTPSNATIEAICDCSTWSITFGELQETIRLYPEFQIHFDVITAQYRKIENERMKILKGLTPRDKYDWLLTTAPTLCQMVPVEHLASYLRICRRLLFRIRKEYAKGGRKGK
jgi:CRP/FNR family transcriptional regulator, anaerobic regulatory protein